MGGLVGVDAIEAKRGQFDKFERVGLALDRAFTEVTA